MTRPTTLQVAAVLLVAGLSASCSGDDDAADTTAAPETTAAAEPEATDAPEAPEATEAPLDTEPPGEFDPYAQTLEWEECEFGECAEATVPIDYDDPSAGTTTIAMSRMASTGSDPIGTLFINPGGPGITGVDRVFDFQDAPADELLENYDVVGFDPRGVGASNAILCLDEAGLDEFHAADLDPTDQLSVDAYTELYQGQGEACLANSPELAQHVTTVETAKDMDVMRALVGDDQMNYFGFSYGSFLGTTYAALFPDRVGRMVLDGPEDPSLTEIEKTLRSMEGFQLAFDDYAADCVETQCPLGGSVEEIDQQVAAMFETAKDEPLPTDDPERPLTRPLAFYGIVASLYAQEQWPLLTDALSAGVEGDGTLLLESADEYLGRNDGTYLNRQVITAINCLDAQLVAPSGSVPTEEEFLAASSVFGAVAYGAVAVGCDQWPIHPTVTAPDYSAPGAAPIVVVGTTGDPATPFENAEQLAAELESGVLLIREGEGHTAYFQGNICISDIINAYLIDGTVPDDGTTCSEDGELVDTTDPTTTTAPATTAAAPTTDAPASTDNGESALGGDPFGTVTMTVGGDVVFEGEIVECTVVDPDVQFLAQGETAEMEVGADAGGGVFVTVSGATQFEGKGTAAFDPATAGIDTGNVTITGSGAQPDDSTPVVDFTVDAEIVSC